MKFISNTFALVLVVLFSGCEERHICPERAPRIVMFLPPGFVGFRVPENTLQLDNIPPGFEVISGVNEYGVRETMYSGTLEGNYILQSHGALHKDVEIQLGMPGAGGSKLRLSYEGITRIR